MRVKDSRSMARHSASKHRPSPQQAIIAPSNRAVTSCDVHIDEIADKHDEEEDKDNTDSGSDSEVDEPVVENGGRSIILHGDHATVIYGQKEAYCQVEKMVVVEHNGAQYLYFFCLVRY